MILINVGGERVVTVENGKIGCLIHRQTGEREHKISNNRPNSNSNSNYVLKSQPFKIIPNTKNNQKSLHKSGGLPPTLCPSVRLCDCNLATQQNPNTLYNNNLSEQLVPLSFLWIYIFLTLISCRRHAPVWVSEQNYKICIKFNCLMWRWNHYHHLQRSHLISSLVFPPQSHLFPCKTLN